MIFYTLTISLLLQVSTLFAPAKSLNLSGFWEGTITQDQTYYTTDFDIQLFLTDKDGKISGTSIINGEGINAQIDLEGTCESGISLLLQDVEIKENTVKDGMEMEWCLKNYILSIRREKDQIILEGHWNGKTSFDVCTPGKVYLKKGVERA
ncbi:MAG: hypothetical protein ACI8YQ_003451 [Polaribacter sp.]|jgi:hypothetical protein